MNSKEKILEEFDKRTWGEMSYTIRRTINFKMISN